MQQGRVSIAPMMGYTDKHFRVLARYAVPNCLLYTQMLIADALLYNSKLQQAFGIDNVLGDVVLQLGGSNLDSLVYASELAADFGYAAINLNIGCPSNKVKLAGIGACLFKQPRLVAECVAAIKSKVDIPVTVKTRIGVDDCDTRRDLFYFVKSIVDAGCDGVILHARKAWLNGISPKDNRTIPKLNYSRVAELLEEFPGFYVGINGGINNFELGVNFLNSYSEVMLGRQGYKSLQLVANLANNSKSYIAMSAVLERYIDYAISSQDKMHHILKHCMGLYYSGPSAGLWRKQVAATMINPSCKNIETLLGLLQSIEQKVTT